MISVHRSEVAVSCDGCATLFTAPTATAASERMYRQHWRISGVNHGWQHFCPACAIEFEADRPLTADEVAGGG
jgi:hypothetical protein